MRVSAGVCMYLSVARKMLGEAGFKHVKVLMEHQAVRWFEAAPEPRGILDEYAQAANALKLFL